MKKALVIDNDRLYVEVLSDILEENGYSVVKAYDGLDALKLVKREQPDIIFVDLIMPKVDGARFCKYVREDVRFNRTPMVVLSATVIENKAELQNIGADAYIPKGPMEQVKHNVLYILNILEQNKPLGEVFLPDQEKAQPRPIVSELLLDRSHMELVIQRMAEGVIEVDQDWKIIRINRAALDIFGKGEAQLIGNHLSSLLNITGSPELRGIIDNLSVSNELTQETATFSEGERVFLLKISNLYDLSRNTGFLLLVQDVTSLSARIENLEKTQADLIETTRLVTLGQLVVSLSHEMNNPLTNILGYTGLILREMEESNPHKKILSLIQAEAIRTRSFGKELLNLVYQAEPILKVISVAQELSNAILIVRNRAQSLNIRIEEIHEANLPPVKAYPSLLRQAFLNLITNSLDAMPDGGTLLTRARKENEHIMVEFEDTGCGMAPPVLDRLFNPFFTAKDKRKHLGLGLSISLGIIQRHRGTISVRSHPGRGSSFTIRLPFRGCCPNLFYASTSSA